MGSGPYRAQLLQPRDARIALPLIGLEHADVTFSRWQRFVQRVGRGGPACGGVVTISDRRGTVHAVLAYRVRNDNLWAEPALHVSDVIMGRLPGDTLAQAVVTCIDRLSAELQTVHVRIDVLTGGINARDRDVLKAAGFRASGALLSRKVRASPR